MKVVRKKLKAGFLRIWIEFGEQLKPQSRSIIAVTLVIVVQRTTGIEVILPEKVDKVVNISCKLVHTASLYYLYTFELTLVFFFVVNPNVMFTMRLSTICTRWR
jgi:hypothetical protein